MNFTVMSLPILLVLGLLLLYWSRHRTRPAIPRSRAPRPWHPAVRILCGLGAVAILAAMTVATWRETQAPYRRPAAPASKLHLPAKPLLELPVPARPEVPIPGAVRITPLKDARLLVHLVFLQDDCPVHAEDLEIRMPEDAGKTLERIVELAGVRYTVDCTLSGLHTFAHNGYPVKLQGQGRFHMKMVFSSGSSSGGKGGNFDIDTLTLEPIMFLPKPPWSLTRTAPVAPRLVVRATLISRDDPLREVTLEEFTAATGAFPPADPTTPAFMHRQAPDPSMPPAHRMFTILGLAMFLLLLAAGLLAQVFTRRGLAFAGTLACVLLYAAALDRLVLSAHVRRLADARQPVAIRCLAAASLPGTVFYQTSAKAALAAAAEDQSAPAMLRAQASRTMARCGKSPQPHVVDGVIYGIPDREESLDLNLIVTGSSGEKTNNVTTLNNQIPAFTDIFFAGTNRISLDGQCRPMVSGEYMLDLSVYVQGGTTPVAQWKKPVCIQETYTLTRTEIGEISFSLRRK